MLSYAPNRKEKYTEAGQDWQGFASKWLKLMIKAGNATLVNAGYRPHLGITNAAYVHGFQLFSALAFFAPVSHPTRQLQGSAGV